MKPNEFIHNFLSEMTEWEIDYDKKRQSKEYREGDIETKNKINKEKDSQRKIIFEKYLSQACFSGLGALAMDSALYSSPPEHLQKVNQDFEQKKKYCFVYTEKGDGSMIGDFGRFTIIKDGDDFKIDNFHYSYDGKKWKQAHSL